MLDIRFFIKWLPLAQDFFKVAKILTIVPRTTNFLLLNNFKLTYLLGNVIIHLQAWYNTLTCLKQNIYSQLCSAGHYGYFRKTLHMRQ